MYLFHPNRTTPFFTNGKEKWIESHFLLALFTGIWQVIGKSPITKPCLDFHIFSLLSNNSPTLGIYHASMSLSCHTSLFPSSPTSLPSLLHRWIYAHKEKSERYWTCHARPLILFWIKTGPPFPRLLCSAVKPSRRSNSGVVTQCDPISFFKSSRL